MSKNNQLIWNLPKDMKFFMESTMGRHIIMGRKKVELPKIVDAKKMTLEEAKNHLGLGAKTKPKQKTKKTK